MMTLLPLAANAGSAHPPGEFLYYPPDFHPGLACFDQPELGGLVPDRWLEGVDGGARVILPEDIAFVVYADDAEVGAREMAWSRDASRCATLSETVWRHGVLPHLGVVPAEQRCIVLAGRFALNGHRPDCDSHAWVSPASGRPLQLAGLWWQTAGGPQFTLLQRRAGRGLRKAAPFMPVIIAESHGWQWLRGRGRLVPFRAVPGPLAVSFVAAPGPGIVHARHG